MADRTGFVPDEGGWREFEAGVSAVEQRVAENLAAAARRRVPVRTGATRDSIEVVEVDGHAAVSAGGAAVFLEFGTARMRPEPFLLPAEHDVAHDLPAIAREAGLSR